MWKCISGLVLAVLLAGQGLAQCPIDINDLPPIVQTSDYGYVKQEGHLRSVVRIVGVAGPGEIWKGSGVYVNYEGLYCVITASHVVRGTNKLFVIFKDTAEPFTVQGVVLANDPTNDCAVIGLYQHPANAEDIVGSVAYKADAENLERQVLQNAGFGGDDVLSAGTGKIIGYSAPSEGLAQSWMKIESDARFGDSGGPIFLPNHKVVGILWGKGIENGQHRILAVRCGYIHVQLREAKSKVAGDSAATQWIKPRPLPPPKRKLRPVVPLEPPVLPWRDKIENEIEGLKPRPDCPKPQPRPEVIPGPKVEVNPVPPQKPDAPKQEVQSDRYRVDRHVAVSIICALALASMAVGFGLQWKKTYTK